MEKRKRCRDCNAKLSAHEVRSLGGLLCHACVDAGATALPPGRETWHVYFDGHWWEPVPPTPEGFRQGNEIVHLQRPETSEYSPNEYVHVQVPMNATGRWERVTLTDAGWLVA